MTGDLTTYEDAPEWDSYALATERLDREIRMVRDVTPRSPHASTAAQRHSAAAASSESLAA